MSGESSTTVRLPRPRVAPRHSVASVANIFAASASRSGTSDASVLIVSRGGREVVTCTLKPVGSSRGLATVNDPAAEPDALALSQVTSYFPIAAGTRGAA